MECRAIYYQWWFGKVIALGNSLNQLGIKRVTGNLVLAISP